LHVYAYFLQPTCPFSTIRGKLPFIFINEFSLQLYSYFYVIEFSYCQISNNVLFGFEFWITNENWVALKKNKEINVKVHYFQNLIKTKYIDSFHEKKVKSYFNDIPYITSQLKTLIRIEMNLLKNSKTSKANSLHKDKKK